MSISFGSTGIKPYVGSKEVQEAYVGSQLVYRAGLPTSYMFLGAETDYYINDNVQLVQRASITKVSASFTPPTYKLAIQTSRIAGDVYEGEARINNAAQFIGQKLKFTAFTTDANVKLYVVNRKADGGGASPSKTITLSTQEESLCEVDVPDGVSYIQFTSGTGGLGVVALDAIRFEKV